MYYVVVGLFFYKTNFWFRSHGLLLLLLPQIKTRLQIVFHLPRPSDSLSLKQSANVNLLDNYP